MARGARQASAAEQQPVLVQIQPNIYCCEPELVGPLPTDAPLLQPGDGGATADTGYVDDRSVGEDEAAGEEPTADLPLPPAAAFPPASPFLANSVVAAFLSSQQQPGSSRGARSAASPAGLLVLSYGSSGGGSAAGVGRYDGGGGRYDSDEAGDSEQGDGPHADRRDGEEVDGQEEDACEDGAAGGGDTSLPLAASEGVQQVDSWAVPNHDDMASPSTQHLAGPGMRDSSSSVLFASAVDPSWQRDGQLEGLNARHTAVPPAGAAARQLSSSAQGPMPVMRAAQRPSRHSGVAASLSAHRSDPGAPNTDVTGGVISRAAASAVSETGCDARLMADRQLLPGDLPAGAPHHPAAPAPEPAGDDATCTAAVDVTSSVAVLTGGTADGLQGSSSNGRRNRRGGGGARRGGGIISLADVAGSVLLSTGVRTSVRASAASGGARRWGASSLALANAARYDEEGEPDEEDEGAQSSPTSYSSASDIDEEMGDEEEASDTAHPAAAAGEELHEGEGRVAGDHPAAGHRLSAVGVEAEPGSFVQSSPGAEPNDIAAAPTEAVTRGSAFAVTPADHVLLAVSSPSLATLRSTGGAREGFRPADDAPAAGERAAFVQPTPGSPAVCGAGGVRLNAFGFRQPARHPRPQPLSAERRAPSPPVFMAVARPRSFSAAGSSASMSAAFSGGGGDGQEEEAAEGACGASSAVSPSSSLPRRAQRQVSAPGTAEEASGGDSLENASLFTQIVDGISIKYRPPPVHVTGGAAGVPAARHLSSGSAAVPLTAPSQAGTTALLSSSLSPALRRSDASGPAAAVQAPQPVARTALGPTAQGGLTLAVGAPGLSDEEVDVPPADGGDSPAGLEDDEQPLWHTNPLTTPEGGDSGHGAAAASAAFGLGDGYDGGGERGDGDDDDDDDDDDDGEGWCSDTCSETCIDGYDRHRQVRNSVGDFRREVRSSRLSMLIKRGSEGGSGAGGGATVVEEGPDVCFEAAAGGGGDAGQEAEDRLSVCDVSASTEGSPGLPMPPQGS